jgi:transcriptional regulator with PAS, ATPase and Fis domain
MQLKGKHLLFYLEALYEFANDISKQRSTDDILKGMLRIAIGTFGITTGLVLVRYAGDARLVLVDCQNLEPSITEEVSQQLQTGIRDDLEGMEGLVDLLPVPQSPSAPTTLRCLMASAGLTTAIVIHVQEQLTAYIGLGPMIRETPFSEHQIELLSALTIHTEVALGNALLYQNILQENELLKEALQKQDAFEDMVGQSARMQEIYKRIKQVARYPNYSVLISGESGTGKELIARAIHHRSPRKDKVFLAINCVALPQELVESELFGYEKGAFTGANAAKPGLFEVAEGGTLFLDEIAEMPTATQAKLLRALEQREVMRIGGSAVRPVDARVIAATNRDLQEAIANGQFRDDLFYRFDVQIYTPPLRDRKEDIPLLVHAFLEEIARENEQPVRIMSPQGLKALMDYDWPGNVRELKKTLMQTVMVTEDMIIRPEDIPLFQAEMQTLAQVGLPLKRSMERFKRAMIEKALKDCNGNKTKAAAQLGITRQNLQITMRRLNIA